VVVWEGVIGYLDDASIERSLAFMANVCGSGSCVVFDYSDYRFGALPAAERVRRAGFTGFESTGLVELSRRYLRGEPHAGASAVAMGVARK
jgi:O-methyltransferase involved in polyketide biosynthesis